LEQLHKAIKDGANCFGYHMWSIIDNWSWRNAYKNRYGFIEVNLLDQSRKLKKSARWFKKMIEKNGFEDSYKKIEETIDLKNIDFTESV
jgi:beta-glucosidase/6-phospho-beta-glucosidase/beta-galactosidase